jgi:hypothetical protein
MAPQTVEQDLPEEGSITEGDTYSTTLTITDDGSTQDITGWTFWLTVKESPNDADSDAIIQKEVTSHVDAANGETVLSLTASETLGISTPKFYDIQYKKPSGEVRTPLKGRIQFSEGYTDET